MTINYLSIQNATYTKEQYHDPSSSDANQITITSNQFFTAKIENGTISPITIAQENEMGTAGGGTMEADPGFTGANVYTINSTTSGSSTGELTASVSAEGGGTETKTLYETQYSTQYGAVYQLASSDVDSDNPDYQYILATNTSFTQANDIPSSIALIDNGQTYGVGASSSSTTVVPCFVAGTRIRTPHGDVAVETLTAGDLVLTAQGEARPVRWMGSHHIAVLPEHNCPQVENLWPVRILAHAFAPNVPDRDLLVSPGHSIAVRVMDELFIPALHLVNGATIRQEPRKSVTYWHVELESHDVLLANNLPAESYLDVGNRALLGLDAPSFQAVTTPAVPARPIMESGLLVDAVRSRLTARAQALGWQATHTPDTHLMVDGQRIDAVTQGNTVSFTFPASAQAVRLVSRTFKPKECGNSADLRDLGLPVVSMHIRDTAQHTATFTVEDACLKTQFHPEEAANNAPWRWTTGDTPLPSALWEQCAGQIALTITLTDMGSVYWNSPQQAHNTQAAQAG